MNGVDVRVVKGNGMTTIAIQGELDISSAPDVERAVARAEQSESGMIVLDLRSLTFMDSTGLRLVLKADARAREEGRRLPIVRGPDRVHRVFEIARLDHRLEFVDVPPAETTHGDGDA